MVNLHHLVFLCHFFSIHKGRLDTGMKLDVPWCELVPFFKIHFLVLYIKGLTKRLSRFFCLQATVFIFVP